METTAHWDGKANEWIINTPSVVAQKYWITNGAVHAKWVCVFAQTHVNGKNEGIHVFLVRIRDEQLNVCPVYLFYLFPYTHLTIGSHCS